MICLIVILSKNLKAMKTKILFKIFAGIICLLPGLALLKAQTVTDINGNVYKTVTIGTQTWMAENLKSTKYNNGIPILLVTDNTEWASLQSGAYCWYNNDDENRNEYGALYNWYAATNNLCPTGWHVPNASDWITLISFLGDSIAGGKLKEIGTLHWYSPNTGATNETGFTAKPGGERNENGSFNNKGYHAMLWSSTTTTLPCKKPGGKGPVCPSYHNARIISYDLNNLDHLSVTGSHSGFSVRCVCNQITSGINNEYSEKVVIYPNPAYDRLYLKNTNYQNVIIMIYDLQGKKVLDRKVDSEVIDISNLSKGIYVVKLVCPESIMITKFIKK